MALGLQERRGPGGGDAAGEDARGRTTVPQDSCLILAQRGAREKIPEDRAGPSVPGPSPLCILLCRLSVSMLQFLLETLAR